MDIPPLVVDGIPRDDQVRLWQLPREDRLELVGGVGIEWAMFATELLQKFRCRAIFQFANYTTRSIATVFRWMKRQTVKQLRC